MPDQHHWEEGCRNENSHGGVNKENFLEEALWG